MDYKVDDLILELQSLHQQFNTILFSKSLKSVQINIETGFRKNRLTLGHFIGADLWSDNKSQITLWTIGLNGDYYSIITTLLHEMVHQYNFEKGIKDTENNQRHNKNFKKTAEEIAKLIVIKHERRGFSTTKLSPELIFIIDKKLDFNINTFKKLIHKDSKTYIPEGYSKNKRYSCKGCNLIINNSREKDLNLMCLECNLILERIK